jgi:hypothetical protein
MPKNYTYAATREKINPKRKGNGNKTSKTEIKHTTAAHNQGTVQQNNVKTGSSTRNTKPRHNAAKTTPKQAAAQPKTLML